MSKDDGPPLKHVWAIEKRLSDPQSGIEPIWFTFPGLPRRKQSGMNEMVLLHHVFQCGSLDEIPMRPRNIIPPFRIIREVVRLQSVRAAVLHPVQHYVRERDSARGSVRLWFRPITRFQHHLLVVSPQENGAGYLFRDSN